LLDRASTKLNSILASHYPTHIPAAIDEAIRQQFPVRLPVEGMRPKPVVR
jgi:trimethylamine:corrinoid methyltransferase-like protein